MMDAYNTFTNRMVKQEQDSLEGDMKRQRGDFCITMRYVCAYCGTQPATDPTAAAVGRKAFKFHTCSFSKLLEHMEMHPDVAFRYMRTVSVRCYHCEKSYQLNDFQLHMRRVHNGNFSAIVSINLCDSCHDHCDDRDQMLRHVIETHRIPKIIAEHKIKSWMVCLLCGVRYEFSSADSKVEEHTCIGAESFMCSLDNLLTPPGHQAAVKMEPFSNDEETPLIDLAEELCFEETNPVSSAIPDQLKIGSKPTNQKTNISTMAPNISKPAMCEADQEPVKKIRYACGHENCRVQLNSVKELEKHLRTHLQKICFHCDIAFVGPMAAEVHQAVYKEHADKVDVDCMALDHLKTRVRVSYYKEEPKKNKRDYWDSSDDKVKQKDKKCRIDNTK